MIQLNKHEESTSTLNTNTTVKNMHNNQPFMFFSFLPVEMDTSQLKSKVSLKNSNGTIITNKFSFTANHAIFNLLQTPALQYPTDYTLTISQLKRNKW